MKPEELRQQLAAKQHPRPGNIAQSVEYFSNKERGEVFMKFTHPTDHIMFTLEKSIHHGYSMIAAAVCCGAKYDPADLQNTIERFRRAELAQVKPAGRA